MTEKTTGSTPDPQDTWGATPESKQDWTERNADTVREDRAQEAAADE